MPTLPEELVKQRIDLPSGELCLWQPREVADLPDDGAVEWAPIAPYWAVMWRSGVALARAVDRADLDGRRVVELGCGLGAPSIAAARGGATALATDVSVDALAVAARNARQNGVEVETARAEWGEPAELVARGPFDLVLAADVLYERSSVGPLLDLLPRLASEAWIADPGRPAADSFLDQARRRWSVATETGGLVSIHRLSNSPGPAASSKMRPRTTSGESEPRRQHAPSTCC